MRATRKSKLDAKRLMDACMPDGVLDEARVRSAVSLLLEKKPRGYAAVVDQFARRVKLQVAKRTARIESAAPLADAARAEILSGLTARYGAGIGIECAEVPELIGGARVQVGSDVFDGSVRGRLQRLREKMNE